MTDRDAPADDPEILRGTRDYREVLAQLHASLVPRLYLEIGVRHGLSLALAPGRGIGIDPAPELASPLPHEHLQLHVGTSDAYFALPSPPGLDRPVDLAFIDGMHLFEFALRDFIHVERAASPCALVAIDDVLPGHPAQASRERRTRAWMGDVWKLVGCLRTWRPDLVLHLFDTWPGGMLVVTGLDPENRVLDDNYTAIVEAARAAPELPPPDVISRRGAVHPDDATIAAICAPLFAARPSVADPTSEELIDEDA
jgi:predicted O-methyltransferase YrrM